MTKDNKFPVYEGPITVNYPPITVGDWLYAGSRSFQYVEGPDGKLILEERI